MSKTPIQAAIATYKMLLSQEDDPEQQEVLKSRIRNLENPQTKQES